MTIEEIKDKYATTQEYDNWHDLVEECIFYGDTDGLITHENEVIQLIQDELKKKIANNLNEVIKKHTNELSVYYNKINIDPILILNVENIK